MLKTPAQPVEMDITDKEPTSRTSAPVRPLAVRSHLLGKVIDDKRILHKVSFDIPAGTFTALLGANGAGKSTLIKILATLIPSSHGTLELFGTPLRTDALRIRSRIGMIGHGAMLYRDLSAWENLLFFGRLYNVENPQERADELLRYINLRKRANDPIRTFSRGMVQRVAIARALMHDPDLLLADEPFSGLDAPSSHLLEKMFRQLQANGKTIILANHDIRQSLELAEKVVVLRRGRVIIDEPTAGLDPADVLSEVSA